MASKTTKCSCTSTKTKSTAPVSSKKATTPATSKKTTKSLVVTNTKEAISLHREYSKSAKSFFTNTGSKARWISAQQIAEWYKNTNKRSVDLGWLARTLSAAVNDGKLRMQTFTSNGRKVRAYAKN